MNISSRARAMIAAALLLAAGLCHAQYAWIDEKGIRQYSDRPPPPNTPLKNILRQPGGLPDPLEAQTPSQTPSAEELARPKTAPTLAERNADFAKRKKAADEQARKDADESSRKFEQKENCDSAREAKQQLESGVRISSTDKNGERGYLNDAERAQRLQRANRVLAECR